MASWKDERLYAVHEVHLDGISRILEYISRGEKIEAFIELQTMVREAYYGSGCITQSLAMDALRGSQHFGNTFKPDEWSQMVDDVTECSNYYELVQWMDKYGSLAASRMGGF